MIRVGIGGWSFEPWRGSFYPADLPQAKELEYASRHVTAIEINATFYRTQSAESFRRWRDATPDGFIFSLKASRASTYRKDPVAAAPSVAHFLQSGITELGPKLGPILWQLAPTRRFDAGEMQDFMALLPSEQDGLRLRHVIEARHASFGVPEYFELLRKHGIAHALIDSDKQALLGDVTGDFVYGRLERAQEDEPAGYPASSLEHWATRFRTWSEGAVPTDVPTLLQASTGTARDCFVYFISGAKVRNPAAAAALIGRLD